MFYTINDFRRKTFANVYNVYEVFKNYFGEQYVDLQELPDDDTIAESFAVAEIPMREDGSGYEADDRTFNDVAGTYAGIHPFILVYWPTVKVTNENDRSIVIYDLYAKITLDAKGRIPVEYGGFSLNRATYNLEQWRCGYLHSHISYIPKENLDVFQDPCLGTGPIKDTIHSLKSTFSEGFDEITWMLFCEELSRYVTVESLIGVPYNRLENVTLNKLLPDYVGYNNPNPDVYNIVNRFTNIFSTTGLQDFILFYLKNGHLAISYQQEYYKAGMSYYEFILDISNTFIDWFNKHYVDEDLVSTMINSHIINKAVVANGKFFDPSYYIQTNDYELDNYIGSKICTFKGKDVTLKIKDTDFTPQESIVLNHKLSMFILNNILKIINYHYTNEYTRQHRQGTNFDNPAALPATTHQRAWFL